MVTKHVILVRSLGSSVTSLPTDKWDSGLIPVCAVEFFSIGKLLNGI